MKFKSLTNINVDLLSIGLLLRSCSVNSEISTFVHSFCLCAGGPDNQVHFEGYQVSNQCMALVRDECLLPCKDAPELGFAKESCPEQYVPDVFFKVRLCPCSKNLC